MKLNKSLIIGSDTLGRGDDRLGTILMANFLRLMPEQEHCPSTICLLNSAVKMVTAGHLCVAHLKTLAEKGVTVLVCKTCLEYYDIEDKMVTGKVSNMKEIQAHLLSGDAVTV